MSRCNDFTNRFIAMNKREQRAFTLAYVWLARKPNLWYAGTGGDEEIERNLEAPFDGADVYDDAYTEG
jgi:hypothetical protein